jgi:NAD(P)-dependent dehydrogenase (short-subunit alcohol dehydrogenase family)
MEIRDNVAAVTGAGSGIGRAIALRLAQAGSAAVVADVDESAGKETVRAIELAGGRAGFVRSDVASEADVQRMVEFAEERFGGLDILVNNAGGAEPPHFPEAEPRHW